MAPKLLNNDQIREVYARRHRDSVPIRDLAREYEVSVAMIHAIVKGTRHAEITGHATPHAWSCTKCPGRDVRGHNIDLARACLVNVLCVHCHASIEVAVGKVLDRRGGVSCHNCDGRLSR